MNEVRAAIQAVLDKVGDGWQLGPSFVVAMGLERIVGGELEAVAWYMTPQGQADWATDGLLLAVIAVREADDDDDD